jgi:hypothetical protein
MSNFIRIVTADPSNLNVPNGAKSAQTTSGSWVDEIEASPVSKDATFKSVSVDKLEEEMTRFLQNLSRIFDKAEQATQPNGQRTGLQLDEIELTIEISGEGEIKLWGLGGGKTGGKGAIALKFKRQGSSGSNSVS